jgi:hypothetical protein
MEITTFQSWIGLGLFGVGYYLGHGQPPTWDVVFFSGGFAVIGAGLIFENQRERGREVDAWYRPSVPAKPSEQPAEAPQEIITGGNKPTRMPLASNITKFLTAKPKHSLTPEMVKHQFVTDDVLPKINSEAIVAKTLIAQRNGNFKFDLTEEYWIESGRFPESREKFAWMKKYKWQYHGLIERRSRAKNAEYIPRDWQLIRAVANGRNLPPPPDAWKP